MSETIQDKATHIYYMGEGLVKNEDVKGILEELDNFPGVFYEGISDKGLTIIRRVD